MKKVAFGFLGTTLDAYGGYGEKRHTTWRPTVSLGRDAFFKLSRIELWHHPRFLKLATTIKEDIEAHPDGARVHLRSAEIKDPWNFEEVYTFLYDFAEHYPFNHEKEEYYVHLTTGTHVAQICLFLLTETRHFPAKLIQTTPRNKTKSESLSVIDLDLSKYDKLSQRFEKKRTNDLEILKAGIATRNKSYNALITEIEFVARTSKEPLLLLGPTGAGKSHLAQQIYLLKQAQHQLKGPLVEVNCATIRGDHAMSALFGHAKGAFTGATSPRAGFLKKADKGLLFLDEIGELGLDEQAMVLRALEEKRFVPLGSDEEDASDFQLIAGTNRDLKSQVRQGAFREDLYHRIALWSFTLPSLQERREDIEPNVEYELKKYEKRTGRKISLSTEARKAYLDFALQPAALWSGNFRDLNASVTRMATFADQGRITLEVVQDEIERLAKSWEHGFLQGQTDISDEILLDANIRPETIDLFERAQLKEVLKTLQRSTSIADASRKLFSVSRKNRDSSNDSDRLRKYLARFGVDAKKRVGL